MNNIDAQENDEHRKLIKRKVSLFENEDQPTDLGWAESSWTRCLYVYCFWWMNPILSKAYKQSLTENDLDHLPYDDKSSVLLNRLESYDWTTSSTWKIVIKEFWREHLSVGLLFLPYLFARVTQPLLLREIVLGIMKEQRAFPLIYLYAVLLTIGSIINSVFNRQTTFRTIRIGVRIRNALTGVIYSRSLSMKLSMWQQINTGQIINLVASDTRKFEDAFRYLHYLWAGPLEAVIIFGLLCWIMKPIPVVLGYTILVIFIFSQLLLSRLLDQYCTTTASLVDKRVDALNEFIHGCYIIKLYNWEKLMENRICDLRQNEFASIHRLFRLRALIISLPLVSTIFVSFVIISTTWLLGYPINIVNTFTTLSLLVQMRITINFYMTNAIEKLNEMRSASKRIDSFMRLTTVKRRRSLLPIDSFDYSEKGTIIMSNASFSWQDHRPCLSFLNVTIEPCTFVGISGPVGSGKSSLFAAILGEMNLIDGQLNTSGSSFAYAAQTPWIFADTLRNNILLNHVFDEQRYRAIIYACCLDFDLSLFGSSGDMIMIGEKGVNLSGGQKARVSLARALYNDADIYLLDDPLAAVDHTVAKQIYERCIGPHGFLKNKTRLLITHQTQFLADAHQIIFLSDGHIDQQGHLDENMITKDNEDTIETSELASLLLDTKFMPDDQPIIAQETSISTQARWRLWYRLFTAPPSGKFGACLLSILLLLAEIFYDATNYWISWQLRETHREQQYLQNFVLIYFGLTLATMLLSLLRVIVFFCVILGGSNELHNSMLKALLHTSIQFFESNPSGRILNRASKDQQVIDDILPRTFLEFFVALLTVIGSLIMICLASPYVLIVLVVLMPVLLWVYHYYLRSSREIKRLENITRSPIYDLFSSTLNGLVTIRAFRVNGSFIQSITNRIDNNTSAYISSQAATQWLGLRLEFMASLVIFATAIFLICFNKHVHSSAIALGLMYATSLAMWLQWTIRQLVEVDIMMTSAERIYEYTQLPSEEDYGGLHRLINTPPEWPTHGTIEFRNYSLRHRVGLEYVLKNINIRIESGQKIGIIGRTGAGKSSLFKGIFRLIHRSNIEGEILIDDIDISRVTLNHLRSHLGTIPQQPMIFSGTLRYNLDPFNHYSDEQCWTALEDVQLKQFVSSHPSGLLLLIGESGNNLSVGQCQLICIARAILKKSKVLLIDEATANIDQKTDEIIQEVIANKFQDRTVLTIAHRLNTVAKSDRIIVLDKGNIVNFDTTMHILQHYQ